MSSPPPPPRGATVDEAEGLAAGSALSKPVGMVGGGSSWAEVSAGTSPLGLSVGLSEDVAVPNAASVLACEIASPVAVGVTSVGLGVGDFSTLLALDSGLAMLLIVGTGASIGTCDPSMSTLTAELAVMAVIAARTGPVGWAMEAEVVIPVGRAAPEVIEPPRPEDGTRTAGSDDPLGTTADVAFAGARVGSTAPEGKPLTDVSLAGTDVLMAEGLPTEVGLGLPGAWLVDLSVDAKPESFDEAKVGAAEGSKSDMDGKLLALEASDDETIVLCAISADVKSDVGVARAVESGRFVEDTRASVGVDEGAGAAPVPAAPE